GLAITKSISIVNDGVGEASILVSGGTIGITVHACQACYINLRGITVQGIGFGGGSGLQFNTGFTLTMSNCVIRNHTGNGISFFPFAASNLAVANTLVADNGGSGISVRPEGTGLVKAVLNRVEAYNNSVNGISVNGNDSAGGPINVTVTNSVAGNNGDTGLAVSAGLGLAFATPMV